MESDSETSSDSDIHNSNMTSAIAAYNACAACMEYILTIVNEFEESNDSSSADELSDRPKRRRISRNYGRAYKCIFDDYLAENCLYSEFQFRRRFRLSKQLFFSIHEKLSSKFEFWTRLYNPVNGFQIFGETKVLLALTLLGYGRSGIYSPLKYL